MPVHRLSAFASQLLVLACLVLVPALWLAPPALWRLSIPQLAALGALALSYAVALYLVTCCRRAGAKCGAALSALAAVAALSTCATMLFLLEWRLPSAMPTAFRREAILTALAIGGTGLALWSMPRVPDLFKLGLFGMIALGGSLAHIAIHKGWWPRPPQPSYSTSIVGTSLYELRVEQFKNWIPQHWRKGGGLASWSKGYLLATGNGELYQVDRSENGTGLSVLQLPYKVPLNAEEFVSGAQEVFRLAPQNYVESGRFRVADLLVQEFAGTVRVLVSHHYWNVGSQCFVVRISVLEGNVDRIIDSGPALDWRTLYETTPCLRLNTDNPRGSRFEGLENGGRLALLSENELLLTVGDHGFDGVNRPEALAQDPAASYGKVVRINIATGESSAFTLGHRNPQGLFVDSDGVIWETEHGPQGGDEINILRDGRNYGWPRVTYGTDYARHSWPLNAEQGRHEGYEEPVFAFVPSVGISSIVGTDGDRFERWRGDLLIGSLKQQTLFRVRIKGGRVNVMEPIPLGQRIRDVIIGRDGRIVIWTDDYSLLFLEPTQATEGDALLSLCSACHGFNVWDGSSALGPNLHGIVGRRVASREDFEYSAALREYGGRWTRARLDAFLANPQAAVPGTRMPFAGIADGAARARLIDYLESLPTD